MKMIPLSEPTLKGNEWRYVKQCLDSGWVSTAGPWVTRFESEFATLVGASHAAAIVNGTAALHLALRLVGVEKGDLVIVPDLTFVAPANAVLACGAEPAFLDIDPKTWQLDPKKLEDFLKTQCVKRRGLLVHRKTGKTVRAVVPVHLLGLACDIRRIVAIARRHKLKVVEDACEGVGVRFEGRHVGTFGDLGAFSFNGNKIATTGGGGMIVTNDPKLAARARYLSTQAKDDPIEYYHSESGYNYRLTSLQAALGLAQLEQLPGFVKGKRRVASLYEKEFAKTSAVTPMPRPKGVEASFWLYTVLLPESVTLARRKEVIKTLGERGVQARPLWHNLHDLPPFRGCVAHAVEHAPAMYRRAISLPSGPELTERQVRHIARSLIELAEGRG